MENEVIRIMTLPYNQRVEPAIRVFNVLLDWGLVMRMLKAITFYGVLPQPFIPAGSS